MHRRFTFAHSNRLAPAILNGCDLPVDFHFILEIFNDFMKN